MPYKRVVTLEFETFYPAKKSQEPPLRLKTHTHNKGLFIDKQSKWKYPQEKLPC